ncbi:nitronate monooxygenase [Nocardia sp. 2]|uniref:Nitronate monooxygenase n=1 Tax=Nocardia acididurans TaxID=2802282 RepID=A0ABS1LYD2_9NOCA|nr:nitronate monooxygenase [Nocardia acididurans]
MGANAAESAPAPDRSQGGEVARSKVFQAITRSLTVPVIAAPMLRVSGPDLVLAACRAGVIGAFPTANARSTEELGAWLASITSCLRDTEVQTPYAPNLIVHPGNPRLSADLDMLCAYRPPLVITSVGSPRSVLEPLHEAGALVFADIASVRHAHRAVEAGVDGLILLTAGAGGQTGWANPFAFVRAVREFFDGPLVLAGGIADGVAARAALMLGADLVYMGTRFLATTESMADPAHKRMVVDADLDDVVLTSGLTGLPTNLLGASLRAAGLDPEAVRADPQRPFAADGKRLSWAEIGSAGHSVSGIAGLSDVAEVVADIHREYAATDTGQRVRARCR